MKTLNQEIGMIKLSSKYSQNTLMTGQPPRKYKDIISLSYGEYAEVYLANQVTNNNEERTTTSVIALYPSGNDQNGWILMSSSTGRLLHMHQWKLIHIGQGIINRVNSIGEKENQTCVSSNFKYKLGNDQVVSFINDDYDYNS